MTETAGVVVAVMQGSPPLLKYASPMTNCHRSLCARMDHVVGLAVVLIARMNRAVVEQDETLGSKTSRAQRAGHL